MHNQHAGLSQLLAAQRRNERLEQAARARLAHGGRPRRRRQLAGWWRLSRWPGIAQPAIRHPTAPNGERSW
jgi:hypothetical protein